MRVSKTREMFDYTDHVKLSPYSNMRFTGKPTGLMAYKTYVAVAACMLPVNFRQSACDKLMLRLVKEGVL